MLLTCKNHPELVWRCKDMAYSTEVGYNGMRNIFFFGWHRPGQNPEYDLYNKPDGTFEPARECSCSAHDLIGIPGTEEGGG